jgi:ubiquinone/menaquinone biosynthesis C-methylase UbiE
MEEQPGTQEESARGQQEEYTWGYGAAWQQYHAKISAGAERAWFLLPYLRPGMRLLDCGCGIGAITVALAQRVAPGEVVGIDIAPVQVERSQALAREQGVANARFEVGNVYALPFPYAAFDAAFAHRVLEHLSDPLRALKEMRRVLKPGGVAGILDPDRASTLFSPSTPLLQELMSLVLRIREQQGSSLCYARHLRGQLLQAGFTRSEGFAHAEYNGNLEMTRMLAAIGTEVFRSPANVELAVRQGWADREKLEAMIAELQAWVERPDAYWAIVECAAVGWVGE